MTAPDWKERHAKLWADLVPDRGQASTVQGEIIRITGRLADEANRNGNVNWDAGHEVWCDYLERTLTSGDAFNPQELRAIREALSRARDYEHPDTSRQGGPLYLLSEMAVRWCDAHPEPIPHEHNVELKR
jgi:hypothetical protein